MRRGTLTALFVVLCLMAGVLLGLLFPRGLLPWDNSWTEKLPPVQSPKPTTPPTSQNVGVQTESPTTLNSRDNIPLLDASAQVITALKEEDFSALSLLVDPQRGLTFTPYSNVDINIDLNFSAKALATASEDKTVYNWGTADGSGAPLSMTFTDYFSAFVYDADYAQATQLAVDKVLISGNSLENVSEAYPDCRFVEYSYPSRDPQYEGLDWCSLKLVFAPGESNWYLVGIIHGQWTV